MRPIAYVQPDPEGWLGKFRFSIPIKPRYFETDMFGHVNNVSYFIYFEQGRVEYLEHLGVAEQLFNDEYGAVVADLECQYLAQVYKKDPLRLHVRVAKLGRSSYDLEYALADSITGQLKAAGRGAMVFIDRSSGRSTPLPEPVKEKIAAFEGMSG
ncbi:acyl-CoA thioesterase [Cohnella sp. CFH 77786]|uniref:acyl-CoA thioesterase n=1 Tax=Cohnella sp. CFH 77786 TaxID=2662265 RepID=UPI001C60CFD4|nr:thioesterase family protein [Cohnella sp. CFH 77786]MBW5448029.1 acyl-CoA thioesterase [Cohnella sp. CFH 77786]